MLDNAAAARVQGDDYDQPAEMSEADFAALRAYTETLPEWDDETNGYGYGRAGWWER